MARLVGRRLTDWVPALVVIVGSVALLEGVIRAFNVQAFLIPKPSAIATTFWDTRSSLWAAGWFTFQEALGGFVLGSGFAILVALFFARFRILGSAFMPYAIAANAIPIIAFAPITNTWFSPLDKSSKISIVAVLCFFPVMVNTLRGLTSVNPRALELMQSYAAGQTPDFPASSHPDRAPVHLHRPQGRHRPRDDRSCRGRVLRRRAQCARCPDSDPGTCRKFQEAWAGILLACLLGIALYLAVVALERLTLRWVPSTFE